MLGLHWGGSHVKRSEGKRALPSLSQTSNLPKIANFKKNTPEIVFVCWHQNPLPSLSQTSNLTKIANFKKNTSTHNSTLDNVNTWTTRLFHNYCTGSILHKLLHWITHRRSSVTLSLEMDLTSNLNLLLNSATFVYRSQSMINKISNTPIQNKYPVDKCHLLTGAFPSRVK